MRTIVMIGRDLDLLHARTLLMKKEGYRVITVHEAADLLELRVEVDLIILCHTLPPEECELSLAIAAKQWPGAKELVLVSWTTEVKCRPQAELFFTIQGPAKLVALVHALTPGMPAQHA